MENRVDYVLAKNLNFSVKGDVYKRQLRGAGDVKRSLANAC